MWLGYGILPKVMVAFLISFFPIVIGAVVGMRSAEKEMIYLAQSMGASELTTFLKIRLPKALPSIFGGLKVGIGQAVVGATVGEFIAAEQGLGYLQLISQVRLDSALAVCRRRRAFHDRRRLLFNIIAWLERVCRCRGPACARRRMAWNAPQGTNIRGVSDRRSRRHQAVSVGARARPCRR